MCSSFTGFRFARRRTRSPFQYVDCRIDPQRQSTIQPESMYTISKGPSQIVAKTRRGLAQKLESLETIRDMTRKNSDSDSSDSNSSLSPPRPVFHPLNTTKRNNHSHKHHNQSCQQPESLTRSQKELIRYVYERWQRVNRQLNTMANSEGTTVTYYQDASPNPALQDFEPFDLEGWWGRRLYHTLTQSI